MTTAFLTRASLTVALAAVVRRGCGATFSRHICKKGHHLGRTTTIRTMGVGASCRSGGGDSDGGEAGGWTSLSLFSSFSCLLLSLRGSFCNQVFSDGYEDRYLRPYGGRLGCFRNFCGFYPVLCSGWGGRLSSLNLHDHIASHVHFFK